MKTGKFIKLNEYNNVKIGYGTVDFKNLKSIYLKLNSWINPINDDDDDFNKIISYTKKEIKRYVYEMSKNIDYIKSESIVDIDIKTKGIKSNKRSFMNIEITIFTNYPFDIKNHKYKNQIKNIIINIIEQKLNNKKLFNFYQCKN